MIGLADRRAKRISSPCVRPRRPRRPCELPQLDDPYRRIVAETQFREAGQRDQHSLCTARKFADATPPPRRIHSPTVVGMQGVVQSDIDAWLQGGCLAYAANMVASPVEPSSLAKSWLSAGIGAPVDPIRYPYRDPPPDAVSASPKEQGGLRRVENCRLGGQYRRSISPADRLHRCAAARPACPEP